MDKIYPQFEKLPYPETSFNGQTIIVTGSNTGLGFEAAKHFTRLEAARVILAVRSQAKGDAAKTAIESATGRNNVVEVWLLEMDSFDSIKEFAVKCESLDRLDAVVANAGVLRTEFEDTDGFEMTIKVNVIGIFLLALNLFPTMRKSDQTTGQTPRFAITTSLLHSSAKFTERKQPDIFKALNTKKTSNMKDRYSVSKLLEVMLVESFSEAMKQGPNADKPVIINSVNPGLCYSDLGRDLKGFAGYFFSALKAFMARTTEVGSRTLVHAAASGKESDGQYLSECRVTKPDAFVRSKEGQDTTKRLHAELITILEQIQPGVTSRL
ncbi:retinol dehydrogenase 12 [Emericellopsis cladophorae]|uniref:Retinol dehydrogenase 12 n=1 Tax=Emericellopsis cladophorae TaxID=2686198 RepID=A0A9P9Y0F8_9HYPO|nr:retinol dehydrogenase 12 [Emericellopsis cladophorae]KAI6781211.1 retinol dehydrogenase 12 [Emericellopsis cladophorae]